MQNTIHIIRAIFYLIWSSDRALYMNKYCKHTRVIRYNKLTCSANKEVCAHLWVKVNNDLDRLLILDGTEGKSILRRLLYTDFSLWNILFKNNLSVIYYTGRGYIFVIEPRLLICRKNSANCFKLIISIT